MYKLRFEEYDRVNNLLFQFPVEEVLKELLLKKKKLSEIYIDNIENPKFLMGIYRKKEFVLIGYTNSFEHLRFVEEKILQYKLGLGNIIDNDLFHFLLNNSSIKIYYDKRYQLKLGEFFYFENKSPYEIKELTKELAQKVEDEIDSDFGEAWDSAEDFFNNGGFGYCMMENNRIISVAWSYFISQTKVEVAVATNNKFQGQNLSTYTSSAMIRDSLERGIVPHWGCNEINKASTKLGEKLGFSITNIYFWIYPQV